MMDSRRTQYVVWKMEQGLSDSEKLQARNNIGAAALASLAASFESRAPSYVWSAGEECTYGGALWMFDANHSGAWTGADVHEVNLIDYFIQNSPYNFKKYGLKVNNASRNYIRHDSDDYVYDSLSNKRCLTFKIEPMKRTCCIGGYFEVTSSMFIDPNQGYTYVFETTMDYDFGNFQARTLFFNKSDNTLYPAYIVVVGSNVKVGFARSLAVSFIDIFDMMAAF